MDNCDLEKLSVSAGTLEPPFKASSTSYKVTVASDINKITLDVLTSDSGASYRIVTGDGSKVIDLKDGANLINIEVTAEDGTAKKYMIEVTKLSASTALLTDLKITGDLNLVPPFASNVYEYSCTAPFFLNTVILQPTLPDKNMKVCVNDSDVAEPVLLNVGDTLLDVKVSSADGTKAQVYVVVISRMQLPHLVSFNDIKDQVEFECPVSLTALYRPVSINGSDPKHTFSAPYIELLTRRSKVDPLDEQPLRKNWRNPEYDLDKRISAASVRCCYAYRGCSSVLKLTELGHHLKECPNKPPPELEVKIVTDTEWYKTDFASSNKLEFQKKHTLQIRNWEKRLQQAIGDNDIEKLCSNAEEQIQIYKQRLPKSGDIPHYDEGSSPLDALHQVAVEYASAIKLKPRDPKLHFLLGLAIEEQYYASEIYGLKKRTEEDAQELSSAKAAGREDEILAICKLHGFQGKPTLENQLQALDAEFHQLKDQGQSGRADYIQTLFIWKSKKAGKDGRAGVLDEESPLHQALLKYLDAWSLNPDNWQYNFHIGRLFLLQGKSEVAQQHLQTSLALRPASPATRFYTGLALLEQKEGPGQRAQEAVMYLQEGLEELITQQFNAASEDTERKDDLQAVNPFSLMNTQLIRGFLKLGALLKKVNFSGKIMTAEEVIHIVADLTAKALCQCPFRGAVMQQLEWGLLEAHFFLLESLVLQPKRKESWIGRRCQALSALLRLTSIPACKELLDMQEKVCQLGVIATPCNSHALYLLGVAQLDQYDNDSDSENAQNSIRDARLSFQASINLENKSAFGPPPTEISGQKWWQDWVMREKEKASVQFQQSLKPEGAPATSPAGKGVARGRGVTARGGVTPRGGTAAQRGAAVKTAAPTARGRGGAVTPAKPSGTSKSTYKTNSKTQLPGTSSEKPDSSQDKVKPAAAEASSVQESTGTPSQDESSPPINRKSHFHHLGLARALSRSEETQEEACILYQEIIAMSPDFRDTYIELADLLRKTNPLAAVDIYCKFPMKPVKEQTFEDAFITGEIVRILMKQEMYDHPKLASNMIDYGKVMGTGCIEKYINKLDEKFKTNLLKTIYAGIHNKSVDDKDLQDFFRFKCWL
ncbi:hypothetical protein AOXY_G6060 [Acipenser oxyrinchus oxyrinchus]|uniref:Cadherin-like beta-sandwich-like domain-containing protein n=1 Tax=Acipenser oxyrinchus oxyrinchus TaxID=40147 RepID=A0AAD8LP90_ACIOX|nr:hypothetical protein AOXY_G6060 [Acipenser oxyrinchus oxyrinchus]